MDISMQLRNLKQLTAQAKAVEKDARQVCQRTVNDFKNRGPGWVAGAVTGVYNIKKKEVLAAKSNGKAKGNVSGDVENAALVFEGQVLTPTHFGMKPKNRPQSTKDETGRTVKKARKYTVTAQVFKGKTKPLGADVFLGSAGRSGSTEIPFQRDGRGRLPIKSVKTVSVPQMVGNKDVEPNILNNINEGLGKRLEHHIAQAEKRRG